MTGPARPPAPRPARVLVVSNGHGEDYIGAACGRALRRRGRQAGAGAGAGERPELELAALPLVGAGAAYAAAGLPVLPVPGGGGTALPSGGFGLRAGLFSGALLGDLRAGLVGLTLAQLRAADAWAREAAGCSGGAALGVLAVGDVVPLAVAAWAGSRRRLGGALPGGVKYGFVGCAKSDFYHCDADGAVEWRGAFYRGAEPSVYLPWERRLLAHPRCRLVAPRDALTAARLRRRLPASAEHRVAALGNPMMDGLEPDAAWLAAVQAFVGPDGAAVAVLPGTRSPELYQNFKALLAVAAAAAADADADGAATGIIPPLRLLVPTTPAMSADVLQSLLPGNASRFRRGPDLTGGAGRTYWQEGGGGLVVAILDGGFAEALAASDVAAAMAGTATEQAVGLGLRVVTLPGKGPQFGRRFAEEQARLLGRESLTLCATAEEAAAALRAAVAERGQTGRAAACRRNGALRMGPPGAADRIADAFIRDVLRL